MCGSKRTKIHDLMFNHMHLKHKEELGGGGPASQCVNPPLDHTRADKISLLVPKDRDHHSRQQLRRRRRCTRAARNKRLN